MAATLVVGLLLAFGRWASDDYTPIGFGHVIRGFLPAGWVLAIEYGMVVLMVTAVIRADRTGVLFSWRRNLDLARWDWPLHGGPLPQRISHEPCLGSERQRVWHIHRLSGEALSLSHSSPVIRLADGL